MIRLKYRCKLPGAEWTGWMGPAAWPEAVSLARSYELVPGEKITLTRHDPITNEVTKMQWKVVKN